MPEADVYGVGSFFHLLAEPDVEVRVCGGLSCRLAGADAVLAAVEEAGLRAARCSCLAACDVAPAALVGRRVLPRVTTSQASALREIDERAGPASDWQGTIGPREPDPERLALHLAGAPDFEARAFARARELGPERVLAEIESSGLQGRGGAGFPAHVKWAAVRRQSETTRYLVLNADEGEPATFKDREILLRRPDLVIEGLAVAAVTLGIEDIYLYLRGEFAAPWASLEGALARFAERGALGTLRFHLHAGHGAYICGEETALLEALEGKRGMPRLKPPLPVERGLWGKPTLVQNVETIACVPAILHRGGNWFRKLGRTEPGTKLYCVSGHVARPGTYEMPLGVSLDELLAEAGGETGSLKAFSPGGASSGFLPASERGRPLDFQGLSAIGSMLGSAGVVVLDESVDMSWAAGEQLRFFEEESCGQCAPCRIGTHHLRVCLDRHRAGGAGSDSLAHVGEVAWQMNEGSICGLGQAAPLALTSALRYFPEDFRR